MSIKNYLLSTNTCKFNAKLLVIYLCINIENLYISHNIFHKIYIRINRIKLLIEINKLFYSWKNKKKKFSIYTYGLKKKM